MLPGPAGEHDVPVTERDDQHPVVDERHHVHALEARDVRPARYWPGADQRRVAPPDAPGKVREASREIGVVHDGTLREGMARSAMTP